MQINEAEWIINQFFQPTKYILSNLIWRDG